MNTISERINEALNRNGMKKIDLSKKTGINRSNISYYCSGEYEPKGTNLYKIADALGVSVAWLIGAEDNPTPVISDERKQKIAVANDMMSQLTPENLDIATALLKAMIDKQ